MKKVIWIAVGIILLLSNACLAEEVLLRWKFTPGVNYYYGFTNTVEASQSKEFPLKFNNEGSDYSMSGNESTGGSVKATLEFMPLLNGMAQLIVNPADTQASPTSLFFTIDTTGTKVQGQQLLAPSAAIPLHVLFTLPENAVSEGSKWTIVIPAGDFGPEITINSGLLEYEEFNGYDCAKISTQINGGTTNLPEENSIIKNLSGQIKGEGTSYFAYKEGKFVKIDLVTEGSAAGQLPFFGPSAATDASSRAKSHISVTLN